MSNRSADARAAATRAEARRRARLAARGELDEAAPADESEPAPSRPSGGGFLQRIFPPAPPLPNRPDPLAGFDPTGPLRPLRERLFLLRANPAAWLVPGLVAFVGFYASFAYQRSVLGLVGTFLLFGGLIWAGWWGWQRPTLYGAAAAFVSFVLGAVLLLIAVAQLDAEFATDTDALSLLAPQLLYQAVLGFVGGWYGGYLRRRQTQITSETRRPRR